MCIGNFNEIVNQEEKIKARPHHQNKINLFKSFLDDNGLMDIAWVQIHLARNGL